MKIKVIEPEFTICKIDNLEGVDFSDEFVFISKTDEEVSLVCLTKAMPKNVLEYESGWRGFRIDGILDFALVGILAKITTLLANQQIGVFAVSTYNTDYVFVKNANLDIAIDTLHVNGYEIV